MCGEKNKEIFDSIVFIVQLKHTRTIVISAYTQIYEPMHR